MRRPPLHITEGVAENRAEAGNDEWAAITTFPELFRLLDAKEALWGSQKQYTAAELKIQCQIRLPFASAPSAVGIAEAVYGSRVKNSVSNKIAIRVRAVCLGEHLNDEQKTAKYGEIHEITNIVSNARTTVPSHFAVVLFLRLVRDEHCKKGALQSIFQRYVTASYFTTCASRL